MVLNRLDHHTVLRGGRRDLHAACPPDRGVRNVTIASNLVGGVDHDDSLAEFIGQHAGRLAQHGRLADPWAAEQQHRLPRFDQIAHDRDGAVDRATDAARESDDIAGAITDGGDAVQCPLDTRTVVVTEASDALRHEIEILTGDLLIREQHFAVDQAGLRATAEIEHDLDQSARPTFPSKSTHPGEDVAGEDDQEVFQVVGHLALVGRAVLGFEIDAGIGMSR